MCVCYITCVLVDRMAIIAKIAIFTNGNNGNSNLQHRPTLLHSRSGAVRHCALSLCVDINFIPLVVLLLF